MKAPTGKSKIVRIPNKSAHRLAYYKSGEGPGVLGPRGWHCFAVYGSNGYGLYVSPRKITSAEVFSNSWTGFSGPAIELDGSVGDTSGRFDVARVIARVFPAYKSFADSVIKEGLEPASSFPFGPYPKDKLTYKSKRTVEYFTPAHTEGLGTMSWLKKNDEPIRGVAILTGSTPSLLLLSVRLSPKLDDLTPAIVRQVERNAAQYNP